ncbi:helix-turn-helix domain-containing protein, partial [Photobacterium damselae subsp. piscicida]|nr:helix-turn-helix domain-containing protein [Photobacterium damselae subsp. piscicida]MDP2556850.1 helix-turn-helix domain-containing protein [Photobacterium damselae subsp. piscicida]
MKLSQDMSRKFELVNALSKLDKPSLHNLHSETKIPESTIKRQLAMLRDEFDMKIIFIRESRGERGATGYYMITDWVFWTERSSSCGTESSDCNIQPQISPGIAPGLFM